MAICRNIQTDDLYRYLGNDEYRNVRTGRDGKIEPDMAQKLLKINLDATELCNEYPLLEEMIKTLKLKHDKND